ncbi:DUF5329 domain-containing protein [Desulfopila sp. IMCC35008]|uniref:DUF5329 family protein n=1 Tax=Desulfopila sp. IMCC35008 TaxID=2653858 RepID=UPI0013D75365|nr:DUF5329 domain-containing protein [Desulfopila sp. IMCC35008]
MRYFFILPQLVYLIFTTSSCLATDMEEIDYLLNFIGESGCTFIRNGKEYPSEQAREHLSYKYNHVKSRIRTAELFIEKIASQSSISKKPYQVRCNSDLLQSRDWLMAALRIYRTRAVK